MGEDNSDPIKVYPELNYVSSPRSCVRVLATEFFSKISVVSTRMHLIYSCLRIPPHVSPLEINLETVKRGLFTMIFDKTLAFILITASKISHAKNCLVAAPPLSYHNICRVRERHMRVRGQQDIHRLDHGQLPITEFPMNPQ